MAGMILLFCVVRVIVCRRAVLRMVVRFGRWLGRSGRQRKSQRDHERHRAKSMAAPVQTYQVRHLIL